MTTSLTSFVPSADSVVLSNRKTGMSGVRLMTRKEFRVKYSLGRADAGREHNAYLREEGIKGNAELASQIAQGHLLVTGVRSYDSGKGTISFIKSDAVVDKVEKANQEVAQLNEKLAAAERELAALRLAMSK